MTAPAPAEAVLEAAGLKRSELRVLPWEVPIWLFETPTGAGVLKVRGSRTEPSLRWEMDLLRSIGARFPVPTPLDMFDGKPWMFVGRQTWLTHTYLAGETFGWDQGRSLRTVGAFLARYHVAVADLNPSPRPGAHGVRRVLQKACGFDLDTVLDSTGQAATFRRLTHALSERLDEERSLIAIHGDFTVDNVLVDPGALHCSGVIDFEMAQLGPRVADLAWSAWRSTRTNRDALTLDEGRLRELVSGYSHEAATAFDPDDLLDWLVIRGLLWVALEGRSGKPSVLAQTAMTRAIWIDENREGLMTVASPEKAKKEFVVDVKKMPS